MSRKVKNRILTGLLILCIMIFLVSGFLLLRYYHDSRVQQSKFEDLAAIVDSVQKATVPPAPPTPTVPGETAAPTEPPAPVFLPVTDPHTGETIEVLAEYAPIFEMNPDTVGWIRLEGTKINYPVLQSPDRPNYYLHRDFEGKDSRHGCIYVQENCDVFTPSDNLTLYGHNMKDGSMFAGLHKLEHKDFWQEHPIITLDTLFEHHRYEIFSVFVTTASEGQGFTYHTFVNAADEAQFQQFVAGCKAYSLIDTGITPVYGDKLITLSTCDYTVTNGRLVVVARMLPD